MPDRFRPHKYLLKKAFEQVPPPILQRVLPYSFIAHDLQFKGVPVRANRFEVHQDVLGPLANQPIRYFEFGVFKGASILNAAKINTHPDSVFLGFDSFEGLPEDWVHTKAERFDLKGALPPTDDPRIQFVKGWFQDTLPGYLPQLEPKEGVHTVIHVDSDLYGSALYVLTSIFQKLKSFDLIFDEFCGDECRAFFDVQKGYPFDYTAVSYTESKYGYPFCTAFKVART